MKLDCLCCTFLCDRIRNKFLTMERFMNTNLVFIITITLNPYEELLGYHITFFINDVSCLVLELLNCHWYVQIGYTDHTHTSFNPFRHNILIFSCLLYTSPSPRDG